MLLFMTDTRRLCMLFPRRARGFFHILAWRCGTRFFAADGRLLRRIAHTPLLLPGTARLGGRCSDSLRSGYWCRRMCLPAILLRPGTPAGGHLVHRGGQRLLLLVGLRRRLFLFGSGGLRLL